MVAHHVGVLVDRQIRPWDQRNRHPDAARLEIERVDDEHAVFVRQHYARDLDEVTAHNLLVNTAPPGVEGAGSVVEAAYRARSGEAS